MQLDTETLCEYRLERAKEDLHTGEFERNLYKIIDGAYRIREKCDYSDFFLASKTDSEVQLQRAENFVKTVEEYINAKKKTKNTKGKEMTR